MSSGFLKRLLLALLGILLVAIAAFAVTLHGSGMIWPMSRRTVM